jgi:hypothetical protein
VSEELRQGGCRCGRVRFEAKGAPMLTMACHCMGCQKMTASAFSLSEGYRSAAFRLTKGEVAIGGIHGSTRHYFCDHCKSWLYTEPEGVADFVNVRSTLFDEPRGERPFVETYLGEGLPWARTNAARSYDKLPAMEEWPRLIEEFATQHAMAMEETKQ